MKVVVSRNLAGTCRVQRHLTATGLRGWPLGARRAWRSFAYADLLAARRMDLALLTLGGLLLYAGAEWLVGGASRLALSFRVPQLIVGLTVVAYGTSAPEVVVGVQAATDGHGDVALGNVIGSNIVNLGLILGVSTLVRPARVDGALQRRELPVLLGSTLLLPVVMLGGSVERWQGGLLVGIAVAYTAWMLRAGRSATIVAEATAGAEIAAASASAAGAPATTSRLRNAALTVAGLAFLLGGGRLFVDAATRIAHAHGVSERMIGLTVVAIGTSLPELATGVIAARRGSSDIAVGNVIGSNIFNVLLCLGTAASAHGIACDMSLFGGDLAVLVGMTVLALVFLRTARTMTRWEGAILVATYVTFLTMRIVGG